MLEANGTNVMINGHNMYATLIHTHKLRKIDYLCGKINACTHPWGTRIIVIILNICTHPFDDVW